MKKILAALLSLFMVLGLIIMPVSADTEGYYTYRVSDGKAEITQVDSSISGDITIPSSLGGYPVTSIDDYAFENCGSITSISTPEGLTSIGAYAFYGCASLTNINQTAPDQYRELFDLCVHADAVVIHAFYS